MGSSDKDKFAAELEGALHIKEQEAIIAEVSYTENFKFLQYLLASTSCSMMRPLVELIA
jgi:hypothetical protein